MKQIPHFTFEDFLLLSTKVRFSLILTTYFIMGGFLSVYFDVFGHTQLTQLNQQILHTTTEITKMHIAVENLHKLKIQQSHDEQHTIIQKLTPRNLSYVFHQLTLLAQQNNIEIAAIKPLAIKKTYGLITQPIAITLNSDYGQSLQFLHNLQHLPLVFTIDDFRIQANSPVDQENYSLNFNMIFDIYSDDAHD